MEQNFEEAIRREVKRRMHEIAAEEINACKDKITKRISKELDSLALGVLDRYDISRNTRELHITVRKPRAEENDNG
jgi:hypothetical protein